MDTQKRTVPLGLCIVTLCSLCACGSQEDETQVTLASSPTPRIRTLDELLALPTDEIDIALAALIVAHETDPEIDIDTCLERIDNLAAELRERLKGAESSYEKLRRMSLFVFEEKRFPATPEESRDPLKSVGLHGFCGKRGNCFPLTVLYVALGRRVGLPFKMVIFI